MPNTYQSKRELYEDLIRLRKGYEKETLERVIEKAKPIDTQIALSPTRANNFFRNSAIAALIGLGVWGGVAYPNVAAECIPFWNNEREKQEYAEKVTNNTTADQILANTLAEYIPFWHSQREMKVIVQRLYEKAEQALEDGDFRRTSYLLNKAQSYSGVENAASLEARITEAMPPLFLNNYGPPLGTERNPLYLPDRSRIFIKDTPRRAYGGPGGTIFLVDPEGNERIILDHTGFPCTGLAVSPDGEEIAYIYGTLKGADLIIIDRNGTPINGFDLFYGLPTSPSWSPDGRFIAFSVQPEDGIPDNDGIYILNLTTREVQRLTKDGHNPYWSLDSKKIIFAFDSDLYLVNIETLEVKGVKKSH